MDPIEAKVAVLKDLVSTLDDHSGARVKNASGPVKLPPKQPKADSVEELPAVDMDERLLKLLGSR